jgi:hypothetical protein
MIDITFGYLKEQPIEQIIELIFRYFQKNAPLALFEDNFYYLVAGDPIGYYIKHFVMLLDGCICARDHSRAAPQGLLSRRHTTCLSKPRAGL